MTKFDQDLTVFEGETVNVDLTVEGSDITSGSFFIEFLTQSIESTTESFASNVNTISFTIPGTATADRGERTVNLQTTYVVGSDTTILSDGEITIRKRAV